MEERIVVKTESDSGVYHSWVSEVSLEEALKDSSRRYFHSYHIITRTALKKYQEARDAFDEALAEIENGPDPTAHKVG